MASLTMLKDTIEYSFNVNDTTTYSGFDTRDLIDGSTPFDESYLRFFKCTS
jgi:hypothetical protein